MSNNIDKRTRSHRIFALFSILPVMPQLLLFSEPLFDPAGDVVAPISAPTQLASKNLGAMANSGDLTKVGGKYTLTNRVITSNNCFCFKAAVSSTTASGLSATPGLSIGGRGLFTFNNFKYH